jgi:hypothetical protein
MPESLQYYLNFSACDALYEPGGPLADSTQVDALQLGPYPDYIELTYGWLRVGHDGEQIALFKDGVWRVGLERIPQGNGAWTIGASPNALLFSDVAITARPTAPSPLATRTEPESDLAGLGAYLELSTSHITRETNGVLFEHAIRVPEDPTKQAPVGPLRASVYRASHGFFIRVPTDCGDEASSFNTLPPDIAALLAHAQAHSADWLVLDADGVVDTSFPIFDW